MSVVLGSVAFRYPGGERDALSGVDLAVEPGTVTLVTGRLGAGCSTLLLVAAGIAPRVTGGQRLGSVKTLGLDPGSKDGYHALAGRVGLLLPTPWTQLSGMSYTVREEVAFGPANLGWDRDRITEAVDQAMSLMRVESLAARDPRTLSGGELQRVMFAAVVSMDPEVLLLDEPTVELDPRGAQMVYDLLPTLSRSKTVLIASTDVDRAAEVSSRVLLLDRGSLVADGIPEDVLGSATATSAGCSTTVAEIMRSIGLEPQFPLTVSAAAARFAR